VNTRTKTFAIVFACCATLLLALCFLYYLIGTRAVEGQLRQNAVRDLNVIAHSLDTTLNQRVETLSALATGAVQTYLKNDFAPQATSARAEGVGSALARINQRDLQSRFVETKAVPNEVRDSIKEFFLYNQKYFSSIACLNRNGQPLFRVEKKVDESGDAIRFQTEDFVAESVRADERVWASRDTRPLQSPVAREPTGAIVRYTVPVVDSEQKGSGVIGALIIDLKLDELLREIINDTPANPETVSALSAELIPASRIVVMIDDAGQILYHTNDALRHQPIAKAMPFFETIAGRMQLKKSGVEFFGGVNGESWLAAYRYVPALNVSLAVAENYSAATKSLRDTLWLGTLVSLIASLIAAALLTRFAARAKSSLERVTEGALAIAEGNLDQRIEVRSSDDMRLLAESFNQMTERLREQLAREAETRQFESFMRLSAMLTHDLKNAIASLSLIVRNMERQFHRAEFRADAMQSLTDATDKLRTLVAKLSDPLRTISGEHKLPRSADLIPVIRRVIAASAEPSSGTYEIETHLPDTLSARVDVERIEKVIENLVINALEAMGGAPGGKLIIEAGPENEREVFFSVRDTGPGISEEFQRAKLFHAFATTKKKGVGLGLYTCREVIRAHGGRIVVESKRGIGTCFRVVLPSDAVAAGQHRRSEELSGEDKNRPF
jgi:signal transduction histidine kinase